MVGIHTFQDLSPGLRRTVAFGYWLLLFWSLFTIAASYSVLPVFLAYTKELVLVVILALSLLIKDGLFPLRKLEWPFLLFHALILIYLPATVLSIGVGYESTVYVEKYFQALLAILAAANMFRLSGIPQERWIRWFVVGCFALIAVNVIGYFYPEWLLLSYNHRDYPSRLVVGQPTPTAYVLSLAFCWLLVIPEFNHRTALLALTMLIGILVIVPGTTLAALFAILLIAIVYRKSLSPGNRVRGIYLLLGVGLFLIAATYLFASTNPAVQYFTTLLEVKVKAILGLVEDPSLSMRSERFHAVSNAYGPLLFFGTGLNSYVTITSQMITFSTNLEHGFRAILVNFGIVGLSLYLAYFARQLVLAIRYSRTSPYAVLHLCVLANYLLHHFSLDVPYFYNMVIPTFFFQEYCKQKYLGVTELSRSPVT